MEDCSSVLQFQTAPKCQKKDEHITVISTAKCLGFGVCLHVVLIK